MDSRVTLLQEWMNNAHSIVFFGGAGVSTESGIPDFRSKDGLYNQHDVRFDSFSPEFLLSHECISSYPDVFFEYYRQKLDTHNIKPNAAHLFLAKLEQAGKLTAVITQNIDGLHQKAGSKCVLELHGSTERNYCTRCHNAYPADYIFSCKQPIPRCTCGGIVRCDVTLYGEQLNDCVVEDAITAIEHADILIIGGTSLSVYPAASFVRYFRGKHLIIINKDHIDYPLRDDCDLEINEPIGAFFDKLGKAFFQE